MVFKPQFLEEYEYPHVPSSVIEYGLLGKSLPRNFPASHI